MKPLDSVIRLFTRRRAKPNAALEPDDFPLAADGTRLVNADGQSVALAKDRATAVDMAARLNEDADRKEEEKWSA